MDSQQNAGNNQISGAITYPSSNMSLTPVAQQPRQPRDLQGLLRFAMEATKAEDAPGNSNLGPMDEERRKFLEEALRSMTVNISEIIHEALKVLTDQNKMKAIEKGAPLPQDVDNAFNNILEVIDDIDVANDFFKMGGFAVFPIAYSSQNEELKAKASSVLGELVQNNPYCQERVLKTGLLNVLLKLVQEESGDTLAKCLFAISCSTRDYEPACQELIAQGGCEILSEILAEADNNSKIKTAFFISYLCRQHPDAKDRFITLNIVKTLAQEVKKGRNQSTEHILSTLLALTNDMSPTVLNQFTDTTLGLREILENHLKNPDLQDESCREEKEYCQQLIQCIFIDKPKVKIHEEAADR